MFVRRFTERRNEGLHVHGSRVFGELTRYRRWLNPTRCRAAPPRLAALKSPAANEGRGGVSARGERWAFNPPPAHPFFRPRYSYAHVYAIFMQISCINVQILLHDCFHSSWRVVKGHMRKFPQNSPQRFEGDLQIYLIAKLIKWWARRSSSHQTVIIPMSVPMRSAMPPW